MDEVRLPQVRARQPPPPRRGGALSPTQAGMGSPFTAALTPAGPAAQELPVHCSLWGLKWGPWAPPGADCTLPARGAPAQPQPQPHRRAAAGLHTGLHAVCYALMKSWVSGAAPHPQAPLQQMLCTPAGLRQRGPGTASPAEGQSAAASDKQSSLGPRKWQQRQGRRQRN